MTGALSGTAAPPPCLTVYGDVALADVPGRRKRRHGHADEKQQRKER